MLKRASLSIALFLSTCFASQVMATQNDLGSRWPNAVDLSSSPNWHVYVFQRDGVKYIQVNDANGTVREVVATAGGQFIVLPMGVDAARVTTPQRPSLASASRCNPPECGGTNPTTSAVAQMSGSQPQLVYRDSSVSVMVTVDAAGNTQWSNSATNVNNGVAADGCEPPECGINIQNPQ